MVNQATIERSEFEPKYLINSDNTPAKTIRDLRRLRDLINQSKGKGLNSIESNEKKSLIDEYGMNHAEAFQLQFVE